MTGTKVLRTMPNSSEKPRGDRPDASNRRSPQTKVRGWIGGVPVIFRSNSAGKARSWQWKEAHAIPCTSGRSSDKLGRRDGRDHAVAPRRGGTRKCDPAVPRRSRTAARRRRRGVVARNGLTCEKCLPTTSRMERETYIAFFVSQSVLARLFAPTMIMAGGPLLDCWMGRLSPTFLAPPSRQPSLRADLPGVEAPVLSLA